MGKEQNKKESVDLSVHKILDLDIRELALKELTGDEVIGMLVQKEKEELKKDYALYVKEGIKEYIKLSKEVKEMKDTPDVEEESDLNGQVINPARYSKPYLEQIKNKVRRINNIVSAIMEAKKGNFKLLEKEMKNVKTQ